MNREIEIASILLSEYKVLEWDSKPLFHNYKRLISYINANLGEEFANLFASPKASPTDKGDTMVRWYSKTFDQMPPSLIDLPEEQKLSYRIQLQGKLRAIREFADKVDREGRDPKWSQLLRQAIIYPNEEAVFAANYEVVIAPWSMQAIGAEGKRRNAHQKYFGDSDSDEKNYQKQKGSDDLNTDDLGVERELQNDFGNSTEAVGSISDDFASNDSQVKNNLESDADKLDSRDGRGQTGEEERESENLNSGDNSPQSDKQVQRTNYKPILLWLVLL